MGLVPRREAMEVVAVILVDRPFASYGIVGGKAIWVQQRVPWNESVFLASGPRSVGLQTLRVVDAKPELLFQGVKAVRRLLGYPRGCECNKPCLAGTLGTEVHLHVVGVFDVGNLETVGVGAPSAYDVHVHGPVRMLSTKECMLYSKGTNGTEGRPGIAPGMGASLVDDVLVHGLVRVLPAKECML